MHVFLTISPAGCKTADEELETEMSPAPKSKPPSSLRCWRPGLAQHCSGSAPGPALAQHWDQPRLSPILARHRDQPQLSPILTRHRDQPWLSPILARHRDQPRLSTKPPPVHALEWEPPAKRARMRPAQPVVQQHGVARAWELPGIAMEQRIGCWAAVGWPWGMGPVGSCKPRASRASSALTLACKRAN